MIITLKLRVLSGVALAVLAQAAAAQDTGIATNADAAAASSDVTAAEASAAEPGRVGLEEIVVTARRQAERLQETPVSVSAISGATLERLNIQDVEKVALLTPNVSLSTGSGTVTGVATFIRGIGNQDPLLSLDSPVGVYIDGVYQGRTIAAGSFDLVDLERVEVLRGPQGTLFGRNTTGGAISLVTRMPREELRIQQKLGYGSFNEWYSRTTIDTGELGNSGLRAVFAYMHRQREGVVNNINAPDDKDPGAINSEAFWAKVAGEWGAFSATYAFDYNDRRGVPLAFQIAALTPAAQALYGQSPGLGGDTLTVEPDRRLRAINQEVNPGQRAKIMGHALTLNYEISPALAVKSITAIRKFRAFQPTRYAEPNLRGPVTVFTPTGPVQAVDRIIPFTAPQWVRQRQFSEELQLLGSTDQWKYVAGLYFFSEKYSEHNPNIFTLADAGVFGGIPGTGLNLNPDLRYRGTSKSYAAFGQVSWTPPILEEKLELTGGIRRTIDKKSIFVLNYQFPGDPNPAESSGNQKFKNWSYNASVNYQFTRDIMAYARIGTGYRSGGFNARGGGVTFEPEKATTYEVGLKSEFFDRRLRVNTAAFLTKYKDLQVAQFSGGQGFADNANARYPGFEVEVQANPVEGLTLDGSVGYVDPEYTLFTQAGIDQADIGRFPYVPKLTTHVGAEYALPPFEFGTLSFRMDYSTTSKRYFHAFNLPNLNPLNDVIRDPGQEWLSARVTLADIELGGGTASVSGWVENLTNHDNVVAGIGFGPALGFAGRNYGLPHRFGIDLTFTY